MREVLHRRLAQQGESGHICLDSHLLNSNNLLNEVAYQVISCLGGAECAWRLTWGSAGSCQQAAAARAAVPCMASGEGVRPSRDWAWV